MDDFPLVTARFMECLRKRFSTTNMLQDTKNFVDRSEALGVIKGMSDVVEYLEAVHILQQGDLDG